MWLSSQNITEYRSDFQLSLKHLETVPLKAQQKTPDPQEENKNIKLRKADLWKREMLELLTQSLAFISMRCVRQRERVFVRA